MCLQTLIFQAVMDTKADCSEIVKKLGAFNVYLRRGCTIVSM